MGTGSGGTITDKWPLLHLQIYLLRKPKIWKGPDAQRFSGFHQSRKRAAPSSSWASACPLSGSSCPPATPPPQLLSYLCNSCLEPFTLSISSIFPTIPPPQQLLQPRCPFPTATIALKTIPNFQLSDFPGTSYFSRKFLISRLSPLLQLLLFLRSVLILLLFLPRSSVVGRKLLHGSSDPRP